MFGYAIEVAIRIDSQADPRGLPVRFEFEKEAEQGSRGAGALTPADGYGDGYQPGWGAG